MKFYLENDLIFSLTEYKDYDGRSKYHTSGILKGMPILANDIEIRITKSRLSTMCDSDFEEFKLNLLNLLNS